MDAKCEKCQKNIHMRVTQCDTSGLTWHAKCFRCYRCKTELNEKTARIRGDNKNELYCQGCAGSDKAQPVCKIAYFSPAYRVTF